MRQIKIGAFAAAADVIHLAGPAGTPDALNGSAVVAHVDPVPDVQAVAVQRHGFILEQVGDEQGQHLLRELVRTVIVGATRDNRRKPEGVPITAHEQVGASLAGGVGAVGSKRCFLGERTGWPQTTVDLVG